MKNLVLINSKIVVSRKPFSYTKARSIYSTDQRFKQTLRTISSAKDHIPECFIVFVDNSQLPTDMMLRLGAEVDLFINPTDDAVLNDDTDLNPTKAVGELAQLIRGLSHIDLLDLAWDKLFKLCGRYVLNSSFDYSKFANPHNVFRVNQPLSAFKSLTCYYTSFYKISRQNYEQYRSSVTSSYDLFKSDPRFQNEPLEVVLCEKIVDKVTVDPIGVTIDCAVDKWIENV